MQVNLASTDYELVPGGAWIAYRGDWAFSMAWLDGDTTSAQWRSVLRNQDLVPGGETLDDLSQRAAESYAPMWPFAKALYSYVKK